MRNRGTIPHDGFARSSLGQEWTWLQGACCAFMLFATGLMQLCWFRVNPETLAVETCVVLDNAERQNVVDGYYATAHWIERNGAEFLGIISHKFADASPQRGAGATLGPDLMRFEFLWEEVK